MSDPTVQYALRDAEYATLGAARSHMERGVALRKRILSDPSTRVLPKSAPPGDQPPPSFLQNTAATRYAPTSANARKEARTKVVHDRQPTELVTDSEDQQDDHDDQPPPMSQLHPRVRAYMQRTQGQEEHASPSHQDGGKETYVTPSYKGKGYKGKHDSFRNTITRLPHNEYSNLLVVATQHAYRNHRLQQGKQSVMRNRLQPI
jgi:hypothetical protein